MAVVVGHVEQVALPRLLLQLIAGALVVRVVHVYQPLRRLGVEVQLPVGHGLRQLGILLGIVAAHLVGVHDAVPVPRTRVVGGGGDANLI